MFYCERAAGFSAEVALQDEKYFDSLIRMLEQALKLTGGLPAGERRPLLDRLVAVCDLCQDLGYGVVDELADLLAEYDVDAGASIDSEAGPGPDRGSSTG